MTKAISLAALLTSLCISAAAYAATGSFVLTAGGQNLTVNGYCAICSPTFGSVTDPILSDGKQVAVLDTGIIGSGNPFEYGFELTIEGFSANPGKSYINSVSVNCSYGPMTFYSSAVYTYGYANGTASWQWRPQMQDCFAVGNKYNVSIQ